MHKSTEMTPSFVFLVLVAFVSAAIAGTTNSYATTPASPSSIEAVKVENDATHTFAKRSTLPAFDVKYSCAGVDDGTCNKAKKATEKATNVLESTLKIKETIVVTVEFTDLESHIPAETSTGRLLMLKDDDDKIRSYPPALAKQFRIFTEEKYDMHIKLSKNKNWCFDCSETQVKQGELQFQTAILHEIVRGLGFMSSWEVVGDHIIQPSILAKEVTYKGGAKSEFFGGFYEHAFDRHLYETSTNVALSNRVDSLNEATDQYRGKTNYLELFSLPIYADHIKDIVELFTTPGSIAFRLPDGDSMVLESTPEVSLLHADFETYQGTDDALMICSAYSFVESERGINVATSPVLGPKTIRVLEAMGYSTWKNPISQKKVRTPTSSEYEKLWGSSAPALVVFNFKSLILVGVAMIYCHM